jgi:hypothetical protein
MKRLGTSFGSAEPQEPYPLPCLNLITLITYQFSLLLFVCLACPWPALLHTLARHHFAARLLAYQQTEQDRRNLSLSEIIVDTHISISIK